MQIPRSTLYDAFSTQSPAVPLGFVVWLARSHALPADLHVLDVGCGTGRMLRPYAEQGWRVTGMEPDPDYRAHAAAEAEALPHVEVIPGGWREIVAGERYDLITAVNGPFAHLLTGTERADALRRSHRALRPGGVLFLDLPNLIWILHEYGGPQRQTRGWEGCMLHLHRHHEIDYDAAVFRTLDDFTIIDPDGRSEEIRQVQEYAITTFAELRYLLEQAGFVEVRAYNGYAARVAEPLRPKGRMLVSARRSPAA